jgi:ADP-ribosyl-[dinitrogen reductase] hydrolase
VRLIDGYLAHPGFYGPTSSSVFDLAMCGTDRALATKIVHERNRGSRSNGSVVRGVPLGIVYEGEELHELSLSCSRLTHYDPVAGECSAFLNQMVAALVRGNPRESAFFHALPVCRDAEAEALLGKYDSHPPVPGLDALECTHAALTCFMRARSFEDAVLSAINLGGDADTVGACTGALAGAFWGVKAIPENWKRDLQDFPVIYGLAAELALIRG